MDVLGRDLLECCPKMTTATTTAMTTTVQRPLLTTTTTTTTTPTPATTTIISTATITITIAGNEKGRFTEESRYTGRANDFALQPAFRFWNFRPSVQSPNLENAGRANGFAVFFNWTNYGF